MPRFKNSEDPALNPLLAIKKELMRRQKDANTGSDIVSTPAVSVPDTSGYGELYKVLVAVNAHFSEVTLELDSFRQSSKPEVLLSDRFKGSALALSQSLKYGNGLLKKLRYDLSGFADDELRGIEKEYNEMRGNERSFEADLAHFKDLATGAPTDAEMDELRAQAIAEAEYGVDPVVISNASRAQKLKYAKARLSNLMKQFATWRPEYQKFVKSLGDALRATNRLADVVGAGYSGAHSRMTAGYLPSHFIDTSPYLPRRFI